MQIPKSLLLEYLRNKYGKISLKKFIPLGKGVHGTGYLVEFKVDKKTEKIILKTLEPKNFGHDYFSDRAQVLLLANQSYNILPRHVKSIDVVGISKDKIVSVGECDEFFILMNEAQGRNYFQDLNEIKRRGYLIEKDRIRTKKLADYLIKIHNEKLDDPILYKRKIRDTVGDGECLMGVIDTYPKVKFTTDEEMTEIVMKCVKWWNKIKNKTHRLCVVHGDFHPGNIWWKDEDFILLDRSRGIYGEAADDVGSLSINYLFYALMHTNRFEGPFAELFKIFVENYLRKTKDTEMLEVLAPFYAFRVVVIANPLFYPKVSDEVRRKLFNFAQNVLDTDRFVLDKINLYLER